MTDSQSLRPLSEYQSTGLYAILTHPPALYQSYGTKSAGCWPNTSSLWAYLTRKYLISSGWLKDNLVLGTAGLYRIPCECGRVYTGQTDPSVDTRLKKHQLRTQLEHPEKSAIPEHSVDFGQLIQFHITSILITRTRYMGCIVREAIGKLHPTSMNRETSFYLSKSWKLRFCSLKKLSGTYTISTGLPGHTQSVASALRLPGFYSLCNPSL
jgi:hypothetical protein